MTDFLTFGLLGLPALAVLGLFIFAVRAAINGVSLSTFGTVIVVATFAAYGLLLATEPVHT